jgi:hypothetical protein
VAAELGGATDRLDLLREQGWAAIRAGDLDTAETLFLERFDLAVAVDNGVAISSCRLNLATIANLAGRHDGAEELLAGNLSFTRSRGQVTCETVTLASRAELVARHRRPRGRRGRGSARGRAGARAQRHPDARILPRPGRVLPRDQG